MNKRERYTELIASLDSLTKCESNIIANMANATAAIKEKFCFFWAGFYLVDNDLSHLDLEHQQLVLGPFQGPVACTRIGYGRGVCGSAWKQRETIIVPDVEQFQGHIACNTLSRSEIVVPMLKDEVVYGVLDIDHTELNTFDEVDAEYLQQIVKLINN